MIYPEVLPDIVSRLRHQDLQIFRSCWYLRIDNCVMQDISLGYFQKKNLLVPMHGLVSSSSGLYSTYMYCGSQVDALEYVAFDMLLHRDCILRLMF